MSSPISVAEALSLALSAQMGAPPLPAWTRSSSSKPPIRTGCERCGCLVQSGAP